MTEFVGLGPNMYSYLIDNGSGGKEVKGTQKSIIKQRLKFENYKKYFQNNETVLRSQQRFSLSSVNAFTEDVNKIGLNFKDDKRLKSFNKVKSYAYGTRVGKVCKKKIVTIFNKDIKYKRWLTVIMS